MVYSIGNGLIQIKINNQIQESIEISKLLDYTGKFKDNDFIVKMRDLFCEVV